MTLVDPLIAQWLTGDGLREVVTDAALIARWGAASQSTERMTTIATRTDAQAEAVRQLAFLGGGGPLVIEEHSLTGQWASYLGCVITLTIAQLGYDAGRDVFVIGAQDERASGISTLTVIRRL